MSQAARAPSRFRPMVFHMALLVPWVALVIGSFERITDNSYLWHIRAGQVQMDAGRVLTSDPFSFTAASEPWRTQSWLAELGYWWLQGDGSLAFTGLMVLIASVIAVAGLALIAYKYSGSVPATAIVILLTAVLFPRFMVPRPVLFSYPLFVLVSLAWDDRRSRWSVPFLFWIWASMHASFIVGIGYVVLRIIQKREWLALRIGVVACAATLVTAHGLGVADVLWDFFGARPYFAFISEWQTPNLLEADLLPVVVAIVLVVYGAIRGKMHTSALWIFAPFLALAFSAERAIATAWIALVPILAGSLEGLTARWARGFAPPVAIGFLALILVAPFAFTETVKIDAEQFPVAAADALLDVPTFHDDYTGGYLIWRWGPERLVFIDDRAELFRERVPESVSVRASRTDWRSIFQRDGIEQALLVRGEPLAGVLESDGWQTVYGDERFIVMRP